MKKLATENADLDRVALGVREVARAAGVSRGLLYSLWKDGLGPRYLKIRNRRLVRVADLRAWLEDVGAQTPARG